MTEANFITSCRPLSKHDAGECCACDRQRNQYRKYSPIKTNSASETNQSMNFDTLICQLVNWIVCRLWRHTTNSLFVNLFFQMKMGFFFYIFSQDRACALILRKVTKSIQLLLNFKSPESNQIKTNRIISHIKIMKMNATVVLKTVWFILWLCQIMAIARNAYAQDNLSLILIEQIFGTFFKMFSAFTQKNISKYYRQYRCSWFSNVYINLGEVSSQIQTLTSFTKIQRLVFFVNIYSNDFHSQPSDWNNRKNTNVTNRFDFRWIKGSNKCLTKFTYFPIDWLWRFPL